MDDGAEIYSHLVVDATGRGSKTPKWLAKEGFEEPDVISVNPNVSSVSRIVKIPENWNKVSHFSIF